MSVAPDGGVRFRWRGTAPDRFESRFASVAGGTSADLGEHLRRPARRGLAAIRCLERDVRRSKWVSTPRPSRGRSGGVVIAGPFAGLFLIGSALLGSHGDLVDVKRAWDWTARPFGPGAGGAGGHPGGPAFIDSTGSFGVGTYVDRSTLSDGSSPDGNGNRVAAGPRRRRHGASCALAPRPTPRTVPVADDAGDLFVTTAGVSATPKARLRLARSSAF